MCTIESYTHILLVHTCSMNVMIIHVHMSIVLSMYFFIIESYYHGRIFIVRVDLFLKCYSMSIPKLPVEEDTVME
jgi:uncharacterized membrane protein YagU involved in acid resistance